MDNVSEREIKRKKVQMKHLNMYCHQIKIGDLFVLNTYTDKLCTKMMGYPLEID
jgi:hypothetical protein